MSYDKTNHPLCPAPLLPCSIELTNCRYAAGPNITKLIIAPLALHSGHFGRHPVGCACNERERTELCKISNRFRLQGPQNVCYINYIIRFATNSRCWFGRFWLFLFVVVRLWPHLINCPYFQSELHVLARFIYVVIASNCAYAMWRCLNYKT